jgi:hypothetical protein
MARIVVDNFSTIFSYFGTELCHDLKLHYVHTNTFMKEGHIHRYTYIHT